MRTFALVLLSCFISCHICFASVGDIFMTVQDPAYYEKLVDQLEQKHAFDSMDDFQKAVADILPKENVEGYHRLGLALYSRGHEQEAAYVLDTFVTPHKTLTPQQGLEGAKELLKKYQKMKSDAGVAPSPTSSAVESKPAPESNSASMQTSVKTEAPVKKTEPPPTDVVYLKNGQRLVGFVREKDEKGLWFEAGEGTRVYLGNNEIKEISRASNS